MMTYTDLVSEALNVIFLCLLWFVAVLVSCML